jgi:16S rRNA U516 pseudouridylate synthase RsuA-like enzyme
LEDGYKTLPAVAFKGIDHEQRESIFNNSSYAYHIQNQQDHSITLSIKEGKYHQIKRMMEAVGNKVIALHRYSIGSWKLS